MVCLFANDFSGIKKLEKEKDLEFKFGETDQSIFAIDKIII